MLVITLGYPVLLDIEGSSLTQGVLNFFRRKLKNCIKIALIVKVELPSHYWYTPYGSAHPQLMLPLGYVEVGVVVQGKKQNVRIVGKR